MANLGLSVLLAAALGLSALVQMRVDRARGPNRQSQDVLWVSDGKVLRALSAGHHALLADIYWTRSVQYYGSRLRDRRTDFDLLIPLIDITVTLDPRLTPAYYFGSMFIAEPPPRGLGDAPTAVRLLKRGIVANPGEWRLWHHLGFLYYWNLHDYERAAKAYQEGARNPNAREWMRVMAAAITEKGGNRETSLFLWSRIYDTTEDPAIRANAARHIDGLRAEMEIGEIQKRAILFHERNGRWPSSTAELVSQGFLGNVPLDPAGYPYQLQPDGGVTLHPDSTVTLEYDYAPSPPSVPAAVQH
jgi:hypothetical protein